MIESSNCARHAIEGKAAHRVDLSTGIDEARHVADELGGCCNGSAIGLDENRLGVAQLHVDNQKAFIHLNHLRDGGSSVHADEFKRRNRVLPPLRAIPTEKPQASWVEELTEHEEPTTRRSYGISLSHAGG